MRNSRFWALLSAGAVGLAAASASGQNTNATTGTEGGTTAQTGQTSTGIGTANPTTTGTDQTTNGAYSGSTPTAGGTTTDTYSQTGTTTQPDNNGGGRKGWWGMLGLLGLLGLTRGKSNEVRRDSYTTETTGSRNVGAGTATAYEDRARAASGTGGDTNARR
jgi:hypothetical protein